MVNSISLFMGRSFSSKGRTAQAKGRRYSSTCFFSFFASGTSFPLRFKRHTKHSWLFKSFAVKSYKQIRITLFFFFFLLKTDGVEELCMCVISYRKDGFQFSDTVDVVRHALSGEGNAELFSDKLVGGSAVQREEKFRWLSNLNAPAWENRKRNV